MKTDDILLHVGEFGRFQKKIYFIVGIFVILTAIPKVDWVFLGAVPKYRCISDTHWNQLNISQIEVDDIEANNITWNDDQRCRVLNNSTEDDQPKCIQWMFDTSDFEATVATDFNLVCHRRWLRAFAYSCYIAGEFVGSSASGAASDIFGRRIVLIGSLIGAGLSGVLAGAFHNFYTFITFRFLLGTFNSGLIHTGFVLAMEMVGPKKRDFVGISLNYFFAIGYASTAAIAYFWNHWQHLQMFIAGCFLLCTPLVWWIPESARWLVAQKRTDEAVELFQTVAKTNKKTIPPELLKQDPVTEEIWKKAKLIDIFKNAKVRKSLFIVGYIRAVIACVYYGLALNATVSAGNVYLNFLFPALMEFPSYAACHPIMAYFGRRIPSCCTLLLAGFGLLAVGFVSNSTVILVLTLVGKFGVTVAVIVVGIYSVELYPTQVRQVCAGFISTVSRIGSISASFIMLLADYWRPLPLLVFGALAVSTGLLSLVLPETQGQPLKDTLDDQEEIGTKRQCFHSLKSLLNKKRNITEENLTASLDEEVKEIRF